MHFQVFSDLHTEWDKNGADPILSTLQLSQLADYYVFPGDIGHNPDDTYNDLLKFIPEDKLIYIPGNHEFYGLNFETVEKSGWHSHTIKILKNKTLIVGNPLWTFIPEYHMEAAPHFTNDFGAIRRLTPKIWNKWHKECVLKLKQAINSEEGNYLELVIVTHFAPLFDSVHSSFLGDKANCLFANDMSEFIEEFKPDLWIHGHMHHTVNYRYKKCQVYCNPRGYPHKPDTLNPDFNKGDFGYPIGARGQYI